MPLVNITSIIRLRRNSQKKGPVEIPRVMFEPYAFQFSSSKAGSGTLPSTGRWAGWRSSSIARFVNRDEEGKGLRWAAGPDPRMGWRLPESRPRRRAGAASASGVQVPSVRLPLKLRGRRPGCCPDDQAVVGRGREVDAAAEALRAASGRPGRPGRDGDTGSRDRTRTGACAPPDRGARRRSWCRRARRSRRCPPAAIRSSWSPGRPEPG